MKTRLLATAVALVAATALSGCVSLFPKTKPAQLYRFDYAGGGSQACPAGASDVGVVVTPAVLPRASATDQLLTTTGPEAAYVAETRWVSPANSLFQDAVERAFTQAGCGVRIVRRVDNGAGAVTLRLDVDRFETVYRQAGAAPTVVVELRALILMRDGSFGAREGFRAAAPASDNRVGAIVSAYDASTTQVLTELVAWTASNARTLAEQQAGPRPALTAPAPSFALPPRGRGAATSSSTTTTSSSTVTVPR